MVSPKIIINSNTFYPAGTQCFADPSGMSCHSFGTSGSPAIRKLKGRGTQTQYSWVGPLSFYSGCDKAWILQLNTVYEAGENPGVFTDGSCYLDWVADQYGMRTPNSYVKDPSCFKSSGNWTENTPQDKEEDN